MRIAISPYHMTTREPPALAALLLAEPAVTMIPAPFDAGDREAERAEQAACAVPRYLEFMESWSWAIPLFSEGVVVTVLDGEDVTDDVRLACRRIEGDEALADLRPLMRTDLFEDERAYLDAISRDLLRGGPDPALTVPVAAGLDSFASRKGLVVARATPSSVAQKAEQRLGVRHFGCALPVLLQASADRLLEARELLAPELGELRGLFCELFDRTGAGADASGRRGAGASRLAEELRETADAYARAFAREREGLLEPDPDEDAPRVVEGMVSLSGVTMPSDAVLRSSLDAVRSLSARRRAAPVSIAERAVPCASMVVKVIGR